jgi:hypothetical protein
VNGLLSRCPAASRAARVKAVMGWWRVKYLGHGAAIHSWLLAQVAAAITESAPSAGIEYSSIMIAMGESLSRLERLREPGTGASVFRLPPTHRDPPRPLLLVGGSPFDSIRRRSTY